jgi:RNA-directed DNA polymerase
LTKSLATPERIQTLQRKLYLKAKREPGYRFYVLYDKVYRADVLAHAYALSKANGARRAWTGYGSRTSKRAAESDSWRSCEMNSGRNGIDPMRCCGY